MLPLPHPLGTVDAAIGASGFRAAFQSPEDPLTLVVMVEDTRRTIVGVALLESSVAFTEHNDWLRNEMRKRCSAHAMEGAIATAESKR